MRKSGKVLGVIQARMSSSRLPGKVLMDISGKTMLQLVVERVRAASGVDEVVVATSVDLSDDPIVEHCCNIEVACFRGALYDVLSRFALAVKEQRADHVVRVTSDCPLADPAVIDAVIEEFFDDDYDYVSNRLPCSRTFPLGIDVEIFTAEALMLADLRATEGHDREHVTPYIYNEENGFKISLLESGFDEGSRRWTVDTPDDLEFMRSVFPLLGERTGWRDVLAVVDSWRREEVGNGVEGGTGKWTH